MKTTAASVLLLASGAAAFAPVGNNNNKATTTQLEMGLFDAFAPKPKPAAGAAPAEDFLGGKGKRITIREDEDNAMWIEDEKTGETKSALGGFFGKGK